jgi:hypothetical protein
MKKIMAILAAALLLPVMANAQSLNAGNIVELVNRKHCAAAAGFVKTPPRSDALMAEAVKHKIDLLNKKVRELTGIEDMTFFHDVYKAELNIKNFGKKIYSFGSVRKIEYSDDEMLTLGLVYWDYRRLRDIIYDVSYKNYKGTFESMPDEWQERQVKSLQLEALLRDLTDISEIIKLAIEVSPDIGSVWPY